MEATSRDQRASPRRDTDAAEAADLFLRFAETRSRTVRNELVERHTGLGHHIARRYEHRGVPRDDLRQVAALGLVKAVERFDPHRGVAFVTFAGRTIEGELKRYFRDATWSMRVPRSIQETHLLVRRAVEDLRQELGRTPTAADVARHTELDEEDVLRALAAASAYSARSLDVAVGDDGETRSATLAATDEAFEGATDRMAVDRLLGLLPERERLIVSLRYYGQLTQSEIAEELGISQMHVSRLLRRSLDILKIRGDLDGSGS